MISRLRTGAKFFTVGLVLGILFAPDSGSEFRERIVARLSGLMPGDRRSR